MAPTDDKPNPWQLSGDDIGRDAQNLTVKQKSLQTLAGYAIDLYDVFDTIEGWTHFVENVDGFGNLPSGIALQGKFRRAGRDLNDRAKSHKTILKDLAQQFITAGKLYTAAEEANTSGFDRLRNARSAERHGSWTLSADGSRTIPDWGGQTGRTDKYSGPPADLEAYANEKDGRDAEPVSPEPASVLDYPRAYSWHQSLIDGMGHTSDVSGKWRDMADHVTEPAANLGNQMTAMRTSDGWNSDAAVQAGGAVQAYVAGVQNMVDGMRIVARNLREASGWLYAAQANTPNIPPNEVGTEYARELVEKAKRIFNDWYVPGLTASSNAIPLMVQPVSPVVKPTAPPPDKRTKQTGTGDGTGGTGGGTGGTGGGTGGASAAQSRAAQQALADQRKAAQQADKTAAEQRQQAEQQRRQAELEATRREAAQQLAAQRQTEQQATQQASQSAQQGMDGVKQAMDQAAQAAAQQAQAAAAKDMQSAGLAGLPSALSALGKDALKAGGGGGVGKGGGGAGGGAGSGAGAGLSSNSLQDSKLFPRAAAAEATGAAMASRAGIASTGQPGSPGGMGPAGHGAGGQNKEHKRAAYLDSVEHIEEALGDAPVVVKPVVEQ